MKNRTKIEDLIDSYLEASKKECDAIVHCHNGRQVGSNPALKSWTTRRFITLANYYDKNFPGDSMRRGLIAKIAERN